ncbi:MAG: sigma-70 family RNA polymerase sigma factor [Balneolia bacterium]|nr:sigma-70 family RNA polymerase sigma factor [Balneolia bacterium]
MINVQDQPIEQQLLSELETLYPRIERSVRAYTNGTGLDSGDLTQDAFLKAVKSLNQYNQDSSLYTWIYRIARNTCIDAMRKLKTRRQYDAPDVDADTQTDSDSDSYKSDYEHREEQNMVRRVMASMPDDYRELIILKDFEGLQYNEIAIITGLQEGTVKSRLFRARVMLKEGLLKAGYVHEP